MLNSHKVLLQCAALQSQIALLKLRSLEAEGKEYDAPWRKNGGKVLRDANGRFYSDSVSEEEASSIDDKVDDIEAVASEVISQSEKYREVFENLDPEQKERVEGYVKSDTFKEVVDAIGESDPVKSDPKTKGGFDRIKSLIDNVKENGLKAVLAEVPGEINKMVEYSKHDEGELFRSAAKTGGAAALVGATIALGTMVSPVLALTVGSAVLAAKTASLSNWLWYGGLAPGLKSAKDHESSWDTVGAFVKGGVGQITHTAAVVTAIGGAAVLTYSALKGVSDIFTVENLSMDDFDYSNDHSFLDWLPSTP